METFEHRWAKCFSPTADFTFRGHFDQNWLLKTTPCVFLFATSFAPLLGKYQLRILCMPCNGQIVWSLLLLLQAEKCTH